MSDISQITIPVRSGTSPNYTYTSTTYDIKDATAARADHMHGSITTDGKIATTTALASGDNIIFRDVSDGNKIKASSLAFGTATTTYLRNDGTWGTPAGTGIPYGATLMPTNPFGGNQLYINSIDNAFAAANKKFWVKVTTHNKVVNGVEYPYIDTTKTITDPDYFVDSPVVSTLTAGNAFEGDYETACTCPVGRYMKVHIQFAPFTDSWTPATGTAFTGYPYGTYYLSYYYVNTPSQNSQVRVYNKYAAHTIGWHLYTCSTFKGSFGQQNFIEQLADSGDYQRSCIEFIIFARDSGNATNLTEIDYKLTRPNLSRDGSTVTKYGAQKLYYNFTWYKHYDSTTNKETIALDAENGNITLVSYDSVGAASLDGGKLTANFISARALDDGTSNHNGVAIATGDFVLFGDTSSGTKITRSTLTFDTTKTSEFLCRDGSFKTALTSEAHLGDVNSTGSAFVAGNLVSYHDTTGNLIKDSGLSTTDVSNAVSKAHSHTSLTLSTTAQAYDGTHTLQLPTTNPWGDNNYYHSTGSWSGLTYTATNNGGTGCPSLALTIPTGTSDSTVAIGNHTHGNISNTGTLTDTAAAAAGNDYVVIRDDTNNKIQTSTIKGTDVKDAVDKKHSHTSLTLTETAQTYDGTHTLAVTEGDTTHKGIVLLGAAGGAATYEAVQALGSPMHWMGTIGTGGTSTTVPSSPSAGDTYKIISGGETLTFPGITDTIKVGDTVVYKDATTKWVLIPSGDEPGGTVTDITVDEGLTVGTGDSNPITSSGTIKHAVPTGASVTSSGLYKISTDKFGHVTSTSTVTASDIPALNYKPIQTAVSDPSASGTSITFIDSISQNTDGVITPTKKTIDIGTGASQVAAGNHTHGNISNTGTLQTSDVTIDNGDKLVITDASDSHKVARASLSFGAVSDENKEKALSKEGTWQKYIPAITYEWNKELSFGSSGKLCIGKFCTYDSNLTIDIDATTSGTYHGTLIIATQNHGNSSGGTIKAEVYGDQSGTIANSIYIYNHGANDALTEVYFSPQSWSKNVVHIRGVALRNTGSVSYSTLYSDIMTSVTAIPAEATLKPTNKDVVPSAYCTTSAGTAAKTALLTGYALKANTYLQIVFTTTNTESTPTLNINGTGAKAMWINGTPSSSSNYSIPAGTYFVFYDGTRYHLRTDGAFPLYPAYVDASNNANSASSISGSVLASNEIASGDKLVILDQSTHQIRPLNLEFDTSDTTNSVLRKTGVFGQLSASEISGFGTHTHPVTLPATDISLKFTGTSSNVTITGSTDNSASGSDAPAITGSVTIGTGTGTVNYTPAGSVTYTHTDLNNILTSDQSPTATEVLTSASLDTNSVIVSTQQKYMHVTATGGTSVTLSKPTGSTATGDIAVITDTSSGTASSTSHTHSVTGNVTLSNDGVNGTDVAYIESWNRTITALSGVTDPEGVDTPYELTFSSSAKYMKVTFSNGSAAASTETGVSVITSATKENLHATGSTPSVSLSSDGTSTNGVIFVESGTSGNPTINTTKAWTDTFASQPTLSRGTALTTITPSFSGTGVELVASHTLKLPVHSHGKGTLVGSVTPSGSISTGGSTVTFQCVGPGSINTSTPS